MFRFCKMCWRRKPVTYIILLSRVIVKPFYKILAAVSTTLTAIVRLTGLQRDETKISFDKSVL